MKFTLTAFFLMVALSGCSTQQMIYQPIAVPNKLTESVQKPLKPNPKKATQKDVAIYLVQQNEALSICNAQLQTIKNWSDNWTSSIKQR